MEYPIIQPSKLRKMSSTSKKPNIVINWKVSIPIIQITKRKIALNEFLYFLKFIGIKKPIGIKQMILTKMLIKAEELNILSKYGEIVLNGTKL